MVIVGLCFYPESPHGFVTKSFFNRYLGQYLMKMDTFEIVRQSGIAGASCPLIDRK
jgi:hypothetical protein